MTEKNTKERVIEGLVGWMEDLEGTNGEELRAIRRELGHDVERSECEFNEFLSREYQNLGIDLVSEADNTPPDTAVAMTAAVDGKPYLGYVSDETGLPPSKVAQEVGSKQDFLIKITQNHEVVEDRVREEICDRTVRKFPQLNRQCVLNSLRRRSEKIAAARNNEYSNEAISFGHILKTSGLTEDEQAFWQNIANGGERR